MELWIKMRMDLPDDPAVIAIAADCNLDEDSVVGKLLRLWSWADRHTTDGNAPRVDAAWVNRFLGCPGFAEAMSCTGWLVIGESGIIFPHFDRHNGQTAKLRAENTARKSQSRNLCDKVGTKSGQKCDRSVTEVGPDKIEIREEYRGRNSSITPSYPETENPSSGSANPPEPNPAQPAPAAVSEATEEQPILTFPCDGKERTWHLTQRIVSDLSGAYPALDVLGEARKALLWVNADPARKKTAKGMLRFLAGWMGRAQDRGAGRTPVATPPPRESREDIIKRLCANDPVLGGKR